MFRKLCFLNLTANHSNFLSLSFSSPGGIPARNSKGERLLLFLGVIDILQSYRLKKKLEHTWKSMFSDGVIVVFKYKILFMIHISNSEIDFYLNRIQFLCINLASMRKGFKISWERKYSLRFRRVSLLS